MVYAKKIGLISCTSIVAGNIMGSGIALLPANLAQLGSISIIGWIVALIGAMAIAYVYARLTIKTPYNGSCLISSSGIASACSFQAGVLYYHANWIGNLAICITAVSYLSTFFLILNHPIPAGITCILIIWILTFVNMLGGVWVGRLTIVGLLMVLIPVLGTSIYGWYWFSPIIYQANWNTSGSTNYYAIVHSILLCIWSFIGVESAVVNINIVKNPKRNIPIATILGTLLAGIIYISATQVIFGIYPASMIASSGAPFAMISSRIVGNWASILVSIFIFFSCLSSLGSWIMLVGQAGVRAAHNGNFPKVYGEIDRYGIPRKGLFLSAIKMSLLMIIITILDTKGGRISDLFGELTGMTALLTIIPYFYSCVNLIYLDNFKIKNILDLIMSLLGCIFCVIALIGANLFKLIGTFIISLIILIFYSFKINKIK
ncbi:cadaverine/lysine antiporter [Candidatus Profftia sp. (ex Adelges kitamiensis)]|uniref:cadaverine/lysine antiporter n=1 Tax=Candidatus Profftia sp. (ex Adelges kitamiensis) TaxID=2864218 RepID=UPI001CE2D26E|nr:cadaverine/lysine antiporter [Candidatus Profftia sp. (ex Adelges kitamiensis)]